MRAEFVLVLFPMTKQFAVFIFRQVLFLTRIILAERKNERLNAINRDPPEGVLTCDLIN